MKQTIIQVYPAIVCDDMAAEQHQEEHIQTYNYIII